MAADTNHCTDSRTLRRASIAIVCCNLPAPLETFVGNADEVHHVLKVNDEEPNTPDVVDMFYSAWHRRGHHAGDGSEDTLVLIRCGGGGLIPCYRIHPAANAAGILLKSL